MTGIARRGLHRVLPPAACLLLSLLSVLGDEDSPHRLAARAQGDTPLMTDLRELCDGIGGRPTGSAACDRAIEWAAKKFRDIGIQTVTVEPFEASSLWLPVSAEASAVSPAAFPIRIAAAPMSPSTKAPIEARIIDAGEGTAQDFARLGGAVRGAIVLVHSSEMKNFDDLFAEYMRNGGLNEAARKHQPAAMLLESTRPRGLLYRHPISLDKDYAPVPTAI